MWSFLGWVLGALAAFATIAAVVLFAYVMTPQDAGTEPSREWRIPLGSAVIAGAAAWGAWRCFRAAARSSDEAVERTAADLLASGRRQVAGRE